MVWSSMAWPPRPISMTVRSVLAGEGAAQGSNSWKERLFHLQEHHSASGLILLIDVAEQGAACCCRWLASQGRHSSTSPSCSSATRQKGPLSPCIAVPYPVENPVMPFRSLSWLGSLRESCRHCDSRSDPAPLSRTGVLPPHCSAGNEVIRPCLSRCYSKNKRTCFSK